MSEQNMTPENDDVMGEAPTPADETAMADAVFNEIMGAEFSAGSMFSTYNEGAGWHAPGQAPAVDTRPDGLYYLATNDTTATYEVVVTGRTILHVLVDSAVTAPMPAFAAGKVHPKATAHPILVATPDRKVILPTKGKAIMGPKHIITDSVKIYVLPRILDILVKVYNLGA